MRGIKVVCPSLRVVGAGTRWLAALGCCWLCVACGDTSEAERAAQNARIDSLEFQLQQLRAAMKADAGLADAHESRPKHPFKVACPQPWVLHTPLGGTLWTCRNPAAFEGLYPQCSVTFQPQAAIETRSYFEFALNAAPPLRELKNIADKRVKLRGLESFEATFESSSAPLPLKLLSVLVPYRESTYAITCSAPSSVFDKQVAGFRQVIDSFGFD
jgi:hypothetical protein